MHLRVLWLLERRQTEAVGLVSFGLVAARTSAGTTDDGAHRNSPGVLVEIPHL
jgi:hypothetical protein